MSVPSSRLEEILDSVGVGIASFSRENQLLYANSAFRRLLEKAPAAALAVLNQARSEEVELQRLAFEPSIGWLTWVVKREPSGYNVQVQRAAASELEVARVAKRVGTDPYSGIPNRQALMVDLDWALTKGEPVVLLLLEPATPPGVLKLDLKVADLILQRVVNTIELETGVKTFRVSPHGLAAMIAGRVQFDIPAALSMVLQISRGSSTHESSAPRGLDFIGGAARSAGGGSGTMLYRQASEALQSEKVCGTLSWRWRTDQV